MEISEEERRQRLILAEQEKNIKKATIEAELALLAAKYKIMEEEYNQAGVLTEGQQAALDAMEAAITNAQVVADIQNQVIDAEYKLLQAKVQNERELQFMEAAEAAKGSSQVQDY